jgi:hypothetical protein
MDEKKIYCKITAFFFNLHKEIAFVKKSDVKIYAVMYSGIFNKFF